MGLRGQGVRIPAKFFNSRLRDTYAGIYIASSDVIVDEGKRKVGNFG